MQRGREEGGEHSQREHDLCFLSILMRFVVLCVFVKMRLYTTEALSKQRRNKVEHAFTSFQANVFASLKKKTLVKKTYVCFLQPRVKKRPNLGAPNHPNIALDERQHNIIVLPGRNHPIIVR